MNWIYSFFDVFRVCYFECFHEVASIGCHVGSFQLLAVLFGWTCPHNGPQQDGQSAGFHSHEKSSIVGWFIEHGKSYMDDFGDLHSWNPPRCFPDVFSFEHVFRRISRGPTHGSLLCNAMHPCRFAGDLPLILAGDFNFRRDMWKTWFCDGANIASWLVVWNIFYFPIYWE